MLITVVGCGDSAKHWIRRGIVIGSNDCEKWNKPVDILILANHPSKFKERLSTIKKSKAKVMTTSTKNWKPIFPNCEQITRTTSFNRKIVNGFIYTSQTTPIMCLSLAIKLGAREIILWGCDMISHKVFKRGTKKGDREISQYLKFFKDCERIGVKVYLGANNTAFDSYLPLYHEI